MERTPEKCDHTTAHNKSLWLLLDVSPHLHIKPTRMSYGITFDIYIYIFFSITGDI